MPSGPSRTAAVRACRARRGSTLVEIGLAMLLFMVIAGTVTAGVGRAVGKDADAQLDNMASDALDGLLAQVEAGGYASAIGAASDPTLPGCPDSDGVCVDVGPHRGRPVTFDVTVERDTRLAATVTTAAVTAEVTLPGGSTVARGVRVLAPASGFAPGERGVVRIVFDGPSPAHAYLLDGDNQAVVGSSAVIDGTAIVSVPPAGCTGLDPCRLALAPRAPYFEDDSIGLTADSAAQQVTATSGAVADVTAATFRSGQATIALAATRPDGTGAGAPKVRGSVCLYAELPDQTAAPLCNLQDAAVINAASFPLPGREDLQLPLPAGVPLPVTTDRPDGTCPPVAGAVGHRVDGWQELAVCTSWTWGHPASWQHGSDTATAFDTATVTLPLDGTAASYTATWSGASAQPATGLDLQPVWSKPREAPGCASDGTCTGVAPGPPPEADECPGQQCFSVATLDPLVTGPRQGTYGVVTVSLPEATNKQGFRMDFADPDGDQVTVTLSEAPTGGILRAGAGGRVLNLGDTVTTFTGSGSVALEFEKPYGGSQLHRFAVTLDDGTTTVVQPVGVYQGPYTWTVDDGNASVTAAQGTTGHVVNFVAVGTSGNAIPNGKVDVAIVGDDGTTLETVNVVTDTGGNGGVTVDLTGNPAAGEYQIRFTPADSTIHGIGNPAGHAPLTVLPTAGLLELVAADLAQGGTGAVTAAATDLAGDPMPDVVVRLVLPDAPAGATLDSYRCATDVTGACTVNILADAATPSGSYLVEATSGAFNASAGYRISPVVGRLRSDGTTVGQGATTTLTAVVLDRASQPAAGATVTATSSSADVTVTPSATSGADGTVEFTVTAAAGATPGPVRVTLTSGAVETNTTVEVRGVATTVELDPASVQLPRSGSAQVAVTVRDAAGQTLADVRVTSSVNGVDAATDAAVTTGPDGVATFTVEARGSSGSGTVTFTAGDVSATLAVELTGGP